MLKFAGLRGFALINETWAHWSVLRGVLCCWGHCAGVYKHEELLHGIWAQHMSALAALFTGADGSARWPPARQGSQSRQCPVARQTCCMAVWHWHCFVRLPCWLAATGSGCWLSACGLPPPLPLSIFFGCRCRASARTKKRTGSIWDGVGVATCVRARLCVRVYRCMGQVCVETREGDPCHRRCPYLSVHPVQRRRRNSEPTLKCAAYPCPWWRRQRASALSASVICMGWKMTVEGYNHTYKIIKKDKWFRWFSCNSQILESVNFMWLHVKQFFPFLRPPRTRAMLTVTPTDTGHTYVVPSAAWCYIHSMSS